MERFTEDFTCPKCGLYQKVARARWQGERQFGGGVVMDWIQLECERCGYTEDRAPLDGPERERKG